MFKPIKLNNHSKKFFLYHLYIGIKKGFLTPTLPDNILKFQENPIIRIFRVLGGLSILLLLSNDKFNFHLYFLLLFLLIGILFLIYHIIISYYRIKHIIKMLKSDELKIKKSSFHSSKKTGDIDIKK